MRTETKGALMLVFAAILFYGIALHHAARDPVAGCTVRMIGTYFVMARCPDGKLALKPEKPLQMFKVQWSGSPTIFQVGGEYWRLDGPHWLEDDRVASADGFILFDYERIRDQSMATFVAILFGVLASVFAWAEIFLARIREAHLSAHEAYASLWHELTQLEQEKAPPRELWAARLRFYLYPGMTWLLSASVPGAVKYLRFR